MQPCLEKRIFSSRAKNGSRFGWRNITGGKSRVLAAWWRDRNRKAIDRKRICKNVRTMQEGGIFKMNDYVFWDLGEDEPVRPSKAALAKVLDAIIRLHGRIHDAHCMELDGEGNYRYPTGSCAVLFRISLPAGADVRFHELTGFRLSQPPKVGIA